MPFRRPLLAFTIIAILSTSALAASKFNRVIFPVNVQDDSGVMVKIMKKPEKIISAMPSITEMLFSLKVGDKIIAVTEFCDYPEEAKKIPKLGREKMNLEKGISLEADLIIMLGDAQAKDIERFRKFNQPVFVINPHTVADVFSDYDKLGVITGNAHQAYSVTQRMRRRMDWREALAKKSPQFGRIKALILISKNPAIGVGKGTFINDLVGIIGINNVIKTGEPYPRLNKEKIIEMNPDIIITTSDIAKKPEHIYNDGKFKKTKAGIEKRVLILDPAIISRPGPRLINALDEIYNFTYGPVSSEAESGEI